MRPARRTSTSHTAALGVLCAGTLMIILDGTVVNVALPTIQRELGVAQPSLAWIVNAYLMAFGGGLLLAGRAGDVLGRKRVFVAGLVTFATASLLCGAAPGLGALIAARFAQGVGGAMTSAVILGMIATLFPEPRARARAIGVYSFVSAFGGGLGLLAGGALTDAVGWRGVFFVNPPIGLAAAALAAWLLAPEPGNGRARGGGLAGDVSRLLRARRTAGANLAHGLMVAGLFGFQFLGALYLQRVLGYGAGATGLAILPVTVLIGALSLGASERLMTRFGPRAVLRPSLALVVAGLALLARAPVNARYAADVLPVMLLLGAGGGLAIPALMTLAMSGATARDAGLASGLINTTQQIGGALGVAIQAAIASRRTDALLAAGEPPVRALAAGYRVAFGVGACLAAAALLVAVALPGDNDAAAGT